MAVSINDPSIGRRARAASHRGFDEVGALGAASSTFGATALKEAASAAADGGCRTLTARGDNPFCGDELEVRAVVRHDPLRGWVVERAAFDGYACTLCLAASDVLMEAAEGQPVALVRATTLDDVCQLLGGLSVGRTRKGCVELPLTVLGRALATVVE
ncbi:MAG TPA: iron-sulfur cluster assembly scaffold protein [Adlercreutzia equolifaciens]|uniref:iron-sulfur cluster assembly scaffold protein n=1 Tax=Adlercreutzia equolifaciens TaxID=446660 RepID=UPI002430FA72|nr:iron-sulfur cluster assembly scaffold protein [Adlercreutzia equolifaciens]HJI12009.1 iron-sulfur cluster assembly scaffold protein [Adlercreutzia equolifaciens]